jgi:subtilase family serine protease
MRPSTSPGVMRYEALVKNTGKAAATLVPVQLTVDGTVMNTRTFASLAPGERRTFVILGPECDRLARLEADPEQKIAESSDADNAYELDCAALRKLG